MTGVDIVDDAACPSRARFIAEAGSIWHRLNLLPPYGLASGYNGYDRPVIVFPGFMVHDVMSFRLRRTLAAAGYDARGWGMGVNRGLRDDTLDVVTALVEDVRATTGRTLALVGWSLGGLIAREVAKLRPDLIERVVTLASPFSGDPRANNVWRTYERVAGHRVDAPPGGIEISVKPPVPTIALWSVRDGLVSPASARGIDGERDVAVRVDCRHLDIIAAPTALRAILDALAMDVEAFR